MCARSACLAPSRPPPRRSRSLPIRSRFQFHLPPGTRARRPHPTLLHVCFLFLITYFFSLSFIPHLHVSAHNTHFLYSFCFPRLSIYISQDQHRKRLWTAHPPIHIVHTYNLLFTVEQLLVFDVRLPQWNLSALLLLLTSDGALLNSYILPPISIWEECADSTNSRKLRHEGTKAGIISLI
jgi:hypothetical protein